jgi:type III secretion protein U
LSGERTEAPTQRRLALARRRGQVARSRELTGAATLGGGLVGLVATWPALLEELACQLRQVVAAAAADPPPPEVLLAGAASAVARLSAPPCLAAALAGAATGLLQTGALMAPGVVEPCLARLDPANGLVHLASGERLALVGLGLPKACLAGVLLAGWLRDHAAGLAALPTAAAPLAGLPGLAGPLLLRLAILGLALGVLDLLLARRRHRLALAMSRDEVRREQRLEEGDPNHREERRRRHRALLEVSPVARATCVVVNPTRIAVALLHRRGLDDAPLVVAKGMGAAARRIRSAARRSGVPIVEDAALARALHRLAEVGDRIPEALYDAAAAVLAHLHGAGPGAGP